MHVGGINPLLLIDHMIWIHITIMMGVILVGTRLQGIGLGIMGGLGLAIFTFMLHVKPTHPPMDVLMIVMAIITSSGALEASGGLHYLTQAAEYMIRKYPHSITFISPLVAYTFTFLGGTGHTVYALLPVIANVAKDIGVRPSRPLSMAVIAAQQAVIASPISTPTMLAVGLLAPLGITPTEILRVCLPATIGGVILAALLTNKLGNALDTDLINQQKSTQTRVNTPHVEQGITDANLAKRSLGLFFLGVCCVIVLGTWSNLRPSWELEGICHTLDMSRIITIIMLSITALIVITCSLDPKRLVKTHVFTSGIQAIISILGITWLGDTFITANRTAILSLAQYQLEQAPWKFGLLLFLMSILLVSQAATVRAILPLGIILGLSGKSLLATLPAVNGVFFLPNYPTILAAINIDSTGTTRVGKFIVNHSFMIPGLTATTTAVTLAHIIVAYT